MTPFKATCPQFLSYGAQRLLELFAQIGGNIARATSEQGMRVEIFNLCFEQIVIGNDFEVRDGEYVFHPGLPTIYAALLIRGPGKKSVELRMRPLRFPAHSV
jgi:hypothetical protein